MKQLKKAKKNILGLTGASLGLGVGTLAIGQVGAEHGEAEGLSSISQQMGTLGTVIGAGLVLGVTKEAFTLPKKFRGLR